MNDLISRKWLVECLEEGWIKLDTEKDYNSMIHLVRDTAPSVQMEKEIPIRVRWSGWKGHRYTRYYCPNCEKPVRNNDCYCHRCGQNLMFPKVTFTDYVPGEKQQTIVTWEDENG